MERVGRRPFAAWVSDGPSFAATTPNGRAAPAPVFGPHVASAPLDIARAVLVRADNDDRL